MFIDYVGLMLINMVGGLVVLAIYVYRGLDEADQRKWTMAFAIPGFVALACGLRMAWTWPLPGPYNVAYGEMSVLFGVLFAGAAVALAAGWDLLPITIYAFFSGLLAIEIGVGFIKLGLSNFPVMTGVGFILTGLAGVLAGPTLCCLRSNRLVRGAAALVLLAAAAIWGLTACGAYWMHLQKLGSWMPH